MDRSLFLEEVRESYRNYDKDPWIFFRELAQNSRDASASEVRIDTGGAGTGREVIVFSDNGKGITVREAEKYLFNLYSSGKQGQKYAVGMYGVGFWTVMRYEPDKILIESFSEEEESWAMEIEKDLSFKKSECRLKTYGTRVTLERTAREVTFEKFALLAEKKVEQYCINLEQIDSSNTPLRIIFRGRLLKEKKSKDQQISIDFSGKNFKGVVSLGNSPKVKIYTGGIPAWEGVSLDELLLINGEKGENRGYIDSGIAPVFNITGRDLKSNISRTEIIDNRALKKVVKSARKSLERLIHSYINYAYPSGFFEKLFLKFAKVWNWIIGSYLKVVLLVLLIIVPVEYFIVNGLIQGKKISGVQTVPSDSLKTIGYKNYYPTVNRIGERVIADINYSPLKNLDLKMFTADIYERGSGFVIRNSVNRSDLQSVLLKKSLQPVFMRIRSYGPGEIYLPFPEGYGIDPASVSVNDAYPNQGDLLFISGSFRLKMKSGGIVKYTAFPADEKFGMNSREMRFFLRIPRSVKFENKIEGILKNIRNKTISKRVETALKLTNILLKYDNSVETASYFKNSYGSDNWLKEVLEIGAGDCDVINGLFALILRKTGIPSRVVVGLNGSQGRAEPGLHSWAEFFDGSWKSMDASVSAQVRDLSQGTSEKLKREFYFPISVKKPNRGLLVIILLAIIVPAAPLIYFLLKIRKKKMDIYSGFDFRNRAEIRHDIAEIAKSYLLNPDIWGRDLGIDDRRIITTLNGERISIKSLIRMAHEGKCFSGSKDNPYVRELTGSNAMIVDRNDKIFEPVIRIIPGIFNLDILTEIFKNSDESGKDISCKNLISALNKSLQCTGLTDIELLYAPKLKNEALMDIDLSGTGSPSFFAKSGFPERFIALNPTSAETESVLLKYTVKPFVALLEFMEYIADNSVFFVRNCDAVKREFIKVIINEGV